MRLANIREGAAATLKPTLGAGRFKQLKNSLGFMPGKKVKHSLRVGATVADAGLSPDDVEAAILHDYIERGGDPNRLIRLGLSQRGMRVLHMLSIDEKMPGADDTASVYHHIQQMLDDRSIPPHDKNIAIVVKCADRIDNVKKRIKKNKLTPGYKDASYKLFQLLLSRYTGDPGIINHIRRKIAKLGVFN